jgi:hypothetical protein
MKKTDTNVSEQALSIFRIAQNIQQHVPQNYNLKNNIHTRNQPLSETFSAPLKPN